MYTHFNKLVFRTPLLPFDNLNEWNIESIENNKLLQEAIYIASPVLYDEMQKLLKGEIKDKEKKERICYSVYRYVSRMSTRCTPFGLFAGCSVSEITTEISNIVLTKKIRKHTRLDMYYLCILSQELSKIPEIRTQIKYFPNTTLYLSGDKYRYIEYYYLNTRRVHHITSVSKSFYLNKILDISKKGAFINDFLSYLTDIGFPEDEGIFFINELIDSQILIGEIDASITGEDFLNKIITILSRININKDFIYTLKNIQEILQQIDLEEKFQYNLYKKLIDETEKVKISCEKKYLIQTDITKETIEANVQKNIIENLKLAMFFLNRITNSYQNEDLTNFIKIFSDRYETKEVSLAEVMDPESGIGYPIDANLDNNSPLIDDFVLPRNNNHGKFYSSDSFQSILFKKVIDTLSDKKSEIEFTDDDIKELDSNWKELSPTIYSIFEIIRANAEDTLIKIKAFSGSCGANLLTRFAHIDKEISDFINQIISVEEKNKNNTIFAEIAHLPNSRIGNILSRPHLRDYEILYLANSDLPFEQLIYISDLTISVRYGKLRLKSKKLNKEIIPRLTSAHNYHGSNMPVYRLLCDLQHQNSIPGLVFNWGHLRTELNFFPRIRYKNIILSSATWIIKIKEIIHLIKLDDNSVIIEIKKWRKRILLPQYTVLQDDDNELFTDWDSLISIRALFAIIKNRDNIKLAEFIFDPKESVVKDIQGKSYLSEYIAVFHKK